MLFISPQQFYNPLSVTLSIPKYSYKNAVTLFSNTVKGFAPAIKTINNSTPLKTEGRDALLQRLSKYYDDMAVDTTQSISQLDKFSTMFQQPKAFTLDQAAKKEGLVESDSQDFIDGNNDGLAADLTKVAVDYGYGNIANEPSDTLFPGPFPSPIEGTVEGHPNIIGFNGFGFIEDLNNIPVDELATPIGDFLINGKYGELLGGTGGMGGFAAGFGALASFGGVGGGAASFGGIGGVGGLESTMNARKNLLEKEDAKDIKTGEVLYDFSELADTTLTDLLQTWGGGLKLPSFDMTATYAVNLLVQKQMSQMSSMMQSSVGNNTQTPSGHTYSSSVNSNDLSQLDYLLNNNFDPESDYQIKRITLSDLLDALDLNDLPKIYDPFEALQSNNPDLFGGTSFSIKIPPMGGGGGRMGGGGLAGGDSGQKESIELGIDFYEFIDEFSFQGLIDLYDWMKGLIEELNLTLEGLDLTPYQAFLDKIRSILFDKSQENPTSYGQNIPDDYRYNTPLSNNEKQKATEIIDIINSSSDDINVVMPSIVSDYLANYVEEKRTNPPVIPPDDIILPPQYLEKLEEPRVVIDNVVTFSSMYSFNNISLNSNVILSNLLILPSFISGNRPIVPPIIISDILIISNIIYINKTQIVRELEITYVSNVFITTSSVVVNNPINIANANYQEQSISISQILLTNLKMSGLPINTVINQWYIPDEIELLRVLNVPRYLNFTTVNTIVNGSEFALDTNLSLNLPLTFINSIEHNLINKLNINTPTYNDDITINTIENKTNSVINIQEFSSQFILAAIASQSIWFIDVVYLGLFILTDQGQHKAPDRSMVDVLYPIEIKQSNVLDSILVLTGGSVGDVNYTVNYIT
jgi:hypothetical protein